MGRRSISPHVETWTSIPPSPSERSRNGSLALDHTSRGVNAHGTGGPAALSVRESRNATASPGGWMATRSQSRRAASRRVGESVRIRLSTTGFGEASACPASRRARRTGSPGPHHAASPVTLAGDEVLPSGERRLPDMSATNAVRDDRPLPSVEDRDPVTPAHQVRPAGGSVSSSCAWARDGQRSSSHRPRSSSRRTAQSSSPRPKISVRPDTHTT